MCGFCFVGSTTSCIRPCREPGNHLLPSSATSRPRAPLTPARIILLTVLLAAALRALVIPRPIIHHPDELWQYLEPAYHLVRGRWVIAWEYREGIRTWLIPALLSIPIAIGKAVSPDSQFYIYLARTVLAALSLLVVGSAAGLGLKISRLHGFFAGFVAAVWFELIYFGPRALSEAIALALILPAAYLLFAHEGPRVRLRFALAGLLLGLCVSVRLQYAPALAVLAIWGCKTRWRDAWIPLVLGGLVGLGVDGAIDAAMGQTPFAWAFKNLGINLIQNKSASFGVEAPSWYLHRLERIWKWFAPVVLFLACVGGRRYPALLVAAVINIAVHSMIPHKEYRFILVSDALIIVLAGMGTADAIGWISKRRPNVPRGALVIGACAIWVVVSLVLAESKPFKAEWKNGRGLIQSQRLAGGVPDACGLALYRFPYPLAAAYAYYDRDTPIYLFMGTDAEARAQTARQSFNVVISPWGHAAELGADYKLRGCTDRYRPGYPPPQQCIYARPGPCGAPGSAQDEINVVLTRLGK